MPDLRFNLERALERLREEMKAATEAVAEAGARQERELRAVAAVLKHADNLGTFRTADIIHVIELERPQHARIPAGSSLELHAGGYRLGTSVWARPLEAGRYRAIVQFVKLDDDEPPL